MSAKYLKSGKNRKILILAYYVPNKSQYSSSPCLYIDGLVQDCSNSRVSTMELLVQSSTKPSICSSLQIRDQSGYGFSQWQEALLWNVFFYWTSHTLSDPWKHSWIITCLCLAPHWDLSVPVVRWTHDILLQSCVVEDSIQCQYHPPPRLGCEPSGLQQTECKK